jgi:hypothetical protein
MLYLPFREIAMTKHQENQRSRKHELRADVVLSDEFQPSRVIVVEVCRIVGVLSEAPDVGRMEN